jgi:phosphate/sulfate permease
VAAGADAVKFAGLVGKVLLPAVLSPIIAGLIALAATYLAYRITARGAQRTVTKGFKLGQIVLGRWSRSRTAPTTRRRRGASSRSPDQSRPAARQRGPTVLRADVDHCPQRQRLPAPPQPQVDLAA